MAICSRYDSTKNIFPRSNKVWNFVQIYQEGHKVITRNFDKTKNLTILKTFEEAQVENLSELLFPDKAQNLNGLPIDVVFYNFNDAFMLNGKIYNKWTYFMEIVAQKLNGTLQYQEVIPDKESVEKYRNSLIQQLIEFSKNDKFDFFPNAFFDTSTLISYNYESFCFMVPLPPKYSIFELVLILPLDKSCWMWLGISVAISFILWSLFEGSGIQWNFLFGMYAFFFGQSATIKT